MPETGVTVILTISVKQRVEIFFGFISLTSYIIYVGQGSVNLKSLLWSKALELRV